MIEKPESEKSEKGRFILLPEEYINKLKSIELWKR